MWIRQMATIIIYTCTLQYSHKNLENEEFSCHCPTAVVSLVLWCSSVSQISLCGYDTHLKSLLKWDVPTKNSLSTTVLQIKYTMSKLQLLQLGGGGGVGWGWQGYTQVRIWWDDHKCHPAWIRPKWQSGLITCKTKGWGSNVISVGNGHVIESLKLSLLMS